MSDPRAASRAKAQLAERFRGEAWLEGVAVVPRGESLAVRLYVHPESGPPDDALPASVEGVDVEIVRTRGFARR